MTREKNGPHHYRQHRAVVVVVAKLNDCEGGRRGSARCTSLPHFLPLFTQLLLTVSSRMRVYRALRLAVSASITLSHDVRLQPYFRAIRNVAEACWRLRETQPLPPHNKSDAQRGHQFSRTLKMKSERIGQRCREELTSAAHTRLLPLSRSNVRHRRFWMFKTLRASSSL